MESSSLTNIYIIKFFAPDQFWFGPDVVHFHWVALKRAEDDDERQPAPNQISDLPVTTDSFGELHIFWHDCDTLGMDGTQV